MKSTFSRCAVGRAFSLRSCLFVAAILAVVPVGWTTPAGEQREAFRELQLGYVALEEGEFESAVHHYQRARELAVGIEEKFSAVFGLGSAFLQLGQLDEAREVFEEAHALKPGEVAATYMLGVTCRRLGEMDAAVIYLAEAAARDPDLTQALVELGIAYGALERHADAEKVCREVLVSDPENIEAHLGLAVALFHQDENEDAVSQFREVLELDPDSVRAHYGLGLALVFAGDREGAIEEVVYLNSHAPELGDDLYQWVFPDS